MTRADDYLHDIEIHSSFLLPSDFCTRLLKKLNKIKEKKPQFVSFAKRFLYSIAEKIEQNIRKRNHSLFLLPSDFCTRLLKKLNKIKEKKPQFVSFAKRFLYSIAEKIEQNIRKRNHSLFLLPSDFCTRSLKKLNKI